MSRIKLDNVSVYGFPISFMDESFLGSDMKCCESNRAGEYGYLFVENATEERKKKCGVYIDEESNLNFCDALIIKKGREEEYFMWKYTPWKLFKLGFKKLFNGKDKR